MDFTQIVNLVHVKVPKRLALSTDPKTKHLSPKILIVKPNSRLSWQYHNRRAEIWQVYKGKVGVVQSTMDIETVMQTYLPGDQIKLEQGMRHRLVGLENYGVVAEIWQHTDSVPSDEYDIIRIQDDFGR